MIMHDFSLQDPCSLDPNMTLSSLFFFGGGGCDGGGRSGWVEEVQAGCFLLYVLFSISV